MSYVKIRIKEGKIRVEHATGLLKTRKVSLIHIHTVSKYPVVGAFYAGDGDCPGISLEADRHTLHTYDNGPSFTYVEFEGYKDWEVFSATASKYSVAITLYKP